MNKKGEEYFKVEHKQLEFNKSNVEEGLISFAEYLNNKYKPLTKEEYNSLENKDKSLFSFLFNSLNSPDVFQIHGFSTSI